LPLLAAQRGPIDRRRWPALLLPVESPVVPRSFHAAYYTKIIDAATKYIDIVANVGKKMMSSFHPFLLRKRSARAARVNVHPDNLG
jgi:hypothetical protein